MKSENKKIIVFGLTLLILAGIIVVVLKGFNVSLDLRAHDKLRFVFDETFKIDELEKVCQEVFGEKEYEIKAVELFSDSVYVVSPTITDEERDNLIKKLTELYPKKVAEVENEDETEVESDENNEVDKTVTYYSYSDAKVRLRDIVKPYIMPIIVSGIIIIVYMAIRYRKLNNGKVYITILKTILELAIVLLSVASIIAILRIKVDRILIPILMFIVVATLVLKFHKFDKELQSYNKE